MACLARDLALSSWKAARLGLEAALSSLECALLALADALFVDGTAADRLTTALPRHLPCLACAKPTAASLAMPFLSVATAVIRLTIAVPSFMTATARSRKGFGGDRGPKNRPCDPDFSPESAEWRLQRR
jgi:hypothetical protein